MVITDKECFAYETYHEGDNKVLKISAEKCNFPPSLEYSEVCMSKVIDILRENSGITTIIISQLREYEYDYSQTTLLNELAQFYSKINREQRYAHSQLVLEPQFEQYIRGIYAQFQRLISYRMKGDPLGAYIELKRMERNERLKLNNIIDSMHLAGQQRFIAILTQIIKMIEELSLIKLIMPHTKDYKLGERQIYSIIFHPTTRPDFMYTKLISEFPDGDLVESYDFRAQEDICQINIFKFDDSVRIIYHLTPPEFSFSQEFYEILDDAKRIMSEHKPTREEFVDPLRMREVFFTIGKDLITDLIQHKNMELEDEDIDRMANALLRYTVGFGLIELILSDPKIQDVNINSPNGQLPVFIVHQDYGDCYTNIYPTHLEVESWATKLRLISGRPLDEANPILDTELSIPGANARIAVISAPLNPSGLAFAFRRHRDKPWTLPLYIQNKMINPLAAGILSFLIDGSRSLLIAGTRSAGKTSLLGAVLVELMRKYRVLTIEDTLELPTNSLRKLGYNIQSMKVAAALTKGSSEVPADEGIRTTLRMGDSALIIGEIRSKEALALYEAMRIGALANVVAGTIHGDSPYGVFDRVVNDLQVPRTSFKATDIVVVANPIRSADGLHRWRRVTQITEVRKHWENDPLAENGFVDLMKYNSKKDELEASDDLINGDSEILKAIAGNVKEWAGNWDSVWDNILLRAKVKETLVDFANKTGNPDLLEAEFVIQSNDQFHKISERIREEIGSLDSKRIFFDWNEWLKRHIKKMDFHSRL